MNTLTKNRAGWVLSLSLGILIISLYSEFIFGDDLFIFRAVGSDTYFQYWPFDKLFGEVLRSGDFSHWTFRIGLGQQIFPLVVYLNPFRLFIHLMPSDFIVTGYAFKMILEIVCAVLFWRFYLRKIGVDGIPNIVFSLLYGFNGYLLLWGQNVSFGVVFSLIPITLYALEMLLKDGKVWPLVLALALFMSISIYFFAMFAVFFSLFVLARLLHNEDRVQSVCLKLVKIICCGAIAGLLAAWIILPEILFYLESPRVGTPLKIGLWDHFGWMHHLSLLRFFSNNILGTGIHYYGPLNYYEAPQVYCGLLTLLLIPQFFYFATAKQRILYGALFVFMSAGLFSPYISHLFNARFTLNNRHTFSIIVFFVFIAAQAFYWIYERNCYQQRLFLFTWLGLFLTVLAVLSVALTFKFEVFGYSEKELLTMAFQLRGGKALKAAVDYQDIFLNQFIPNLAKECLKIILILAAYGFVFLLFANRKISNFKPLLFIVVAEIIVLSYPTVNKRAVLETDYITGHEGYYDGTIAAHKYLESIDPEFYRVTKTYDSVFLNDAAFQGYNGTKGYSSLTEPATIQFYKKMGVVFYKNHKSSNYQGGFDQRPPLNDLFGVKYLLSKEIITKPNLTFLTNVEGINVYRNEKARPLGFVYNRVWDVDTFNYFSARVKDNALLKGAVVPGALISAIKNQNNGIMILNQDSKDKKIASKEDARKDKTGFPSVNSVVISEFKPNRIKGSVKLDQPGLIFFSIPHNRGWRAYVEGQQVDVFSVNNGFLGFLADRGAHTVELVFKPYGSDIGRYASLGALFLFLIVSFYQRKTCIV